MKTLLLISSLLLNAFILLAQNTKSTDVPLKRFTRTEILAGPSIIIIRDSPLTLYEKRVVDFDYAFGLGKAYFISNHFKLVGRIFYEKKGGKRLDAEQVGSVIYPDAFITKDIFTCISLPVNICYAFGSKVRYEAEVGVYLGFPLKAATDQSSSVSNFKSYNDITNNLKSLDYGLSSSVGVIVPLSKSNDLSFRLLNNWGVPNVLNVTTDTWKTFSLIFLVGYQIPSFK